MEFTWRATELYGSRDRALRRCTRAAFRCPDLLSRDATAQSVRTLLGSTYTQKPINNVPHACSFEAYFHPGPQKSSIPALHRVFPKESDLAS